ncbi:MAG: efflux transporter outer membrane subunit [Betaproteobacteria bacterium]|nr:efflux transporter outer membrane subunit [Betaproteobacteria bacterium]
MHSLPFLPRTARALLIATLLAALLSACGSVSSMMPSAKPVAAMPARWFAPLPGEGALAHDGQIASLADWWRQQQDPVLLVLIDAAQAASSSISAARSRIAQANAERLAAAGALRPTVDAGVSAQRRSAFPPFPGGNVYQGSVQASWEIDVFGANRMALDAAQRRAQGAEASWHEARVSVAAETANQYYAFRACRRLLVLAEADVTSRAEIARLTELAANAGFQSAANAALTRASVADGRSQVTALRAQCDVDVKALVMLTGLDERDLRTQLEGVSVALPLPAPVPLTELPAATLAQRPDVYAAAQQVAAASSEVGSAEARRYPRLSLSGSIGRNRFETADGNFNLSSWTVGPVAFSLPIFDSNRRRANVAAAAARYEEAASGYHAVVRRAVREVEESLVNLDSIAARSNDAQIAIDGYTASFDAARLRYQLGLSSLIELEEARRSKLAAETGLVTLQRERVAAWIALYRAAGGGWQSPANTGRASADAAP